MENILNVCQGDYITLWKYDECYESLHFPLDKNVHPCYIFKLSLYRFTDSLQPTNETQAKKHWYEYHY